MNPYLLPSIEFGPTIIQRLIRDIPQSMWDEPTEPGRFTVREAIAHLADWEPIWLRRFQSGLENPGGTIVPFDIGQLASDHDYESQDPIKKAERFVSGRHNVAVLLRSMTPEQFGYTIDNPERGVMTLEDLANMLLGHDLYHIEQLTVYLNRKQS